MSLGAVCQLAGTLLTALASALWVGAGLMLTLGSRRIPRLDAVDPLPDAALPSLTLIAAAKDEAARVEAASRSLLAQDYPGVQILLVDDRSQDETGAILDRVAATDPRVRVIHVAALPPGWIGKSHALATAASRGTTEWLLFTDGDVWLAPDAARRAISLALEERADHLAIAPDLVVDSITEALFVGYFVVMFNWSQRPWKAQDPRSNASIGIGAFNLVRRDVYERAGGHRAIAFDLLDDIGLGRLLKRSGARQLFAHHAGLVRAKWHEGARGLVRGVEKNAFAAFGFRSVPAFAAVLGQLVLAIAPVVGFLLPGPGPKALAGLAWLGVLLAYRVASQMVPVRTWHALFMPLGGILFAYAILRSAVMTLARGGVVWRGTFYSLEDLRRGDAGPSAP